MNEVTDKKQRHRPSGRGKRKRHRLSGRGKAIKEVSAGGIVFKRTSRGVRVALILDPFGKWAFAKGHVEKGETIRDAAVREAMEEMGLSDLKVIKPLGKIDFWFRDRYRKESRGRLIHKDVHYFLMEAPADAKGKPQKKEKIRRLIWTGLANVERKSGYTDVKPIVAKALQHFGVAMKGQEKDMRRARAIGGNKTTQAQTGQRGRQGGQKTATAHRRRRDQKRKPGMKS